MTTLPSAAALALLVLVAGVAGVVAADTTATPTATETTAVDNATDPETTTLPPDDESSFKERLAHRLSQFELTDEQVRTIVSDAVRLRDDGASRLVVRSSIVLHLYEFGVDAPFLYAVGDDATTPAERIAAQLGERFDLSDAQVDEIAATIERLHTDGASRTEIYRAVHALLVDYGVDEDELDDLRKRALHAKAHELHERAHAMHEEAYRLHHAAEHDRPTDVADRPVPGDAVDRHLDQLEDRYDLTHDEVATLDRLIDEMLDDGAPREEIRDAVRDQLHVWGYDVPTVDRPVGDGADR